MSWVLVSQAGGKHAIRRVLFFSAALWALPSVLFWAALVAFASVLDFSSRCMLVLHRGGGGGQCLLMSQSAHAYFCKRHRYFQYAARAADAVCLVPPPAREHAVQGVRVQRLEPGAQALALHRRHARAALLHLVPQPRCIEGRRKSVSHTGFLSVLACSQYI